MEKIQKKYENLCGKNSDINEHLPVIKKYAEDCETIIEMGVRSIISTWALLAAKPRKLTSIDIVHPSVYKNHDPEGCNLDEVYVLAKENGIDFQFQIGDTLKITIENCDLLLLDTLHTYTQLISELRLHSDKAKKYILMHDTETYKNTGEDKAEKGLFNAIEEFLLENKNWKIKEVYKNNNGLTILERV